MTPKSKEIQYLETQKKVEASEKEIGEFLRGAELQEEDRVRLTRVLQLIDRFEPDRKVKGDKMHKVLEYFKTAYHSLPGARGKKKQPENLSSGAYLLAEQAVANLRDLRSIDSKVEEDPEFSEDAILSQERRGETTEKEEIETSITLDYEKKNWGVERVCLDGIQNHLPEDSKGERVWVQCMVGDEWVQLSDAKTQRRRIRAVRFVDDGVGFDVKNLALLYSTKSAEQQSKGQFGEGMKMMSAAALREGLDPQIESGDWSARPVAKKVTLKDTRHNEDREVEQLTYHVTHYDGEPMVGSRTTFWHPNEKFVDELVQIDEKVLDLRPNYRPLFVSDRGQIVDRVPGRIFAKGIFITEANTLFSYNFDNVETNRDRNQITNSDIKYEIRRIIEELDDKGVIKTFLSRCLENPDCIEAEFYDPRIKNPELWKKSFYEVFGEEACLDTGYAIPDVFKNKNIKKIKYRGQWEVILSRLGIKTDREAIPDYYEDKINTSLTLEYGKDAWSEERIMLDALQNHLPRDTQGNWIKLRFQTKDGRWYDYSDLGEFKNEDVAAIRIGDDGRGYDARLLGYFYSTKGGTESGGKFGEGLKMLSVAALRQGLDMTLTSQNWEAKPAIRTEVVDGREIRSLQFEVVYHTKGKNEDSDPERKRFMSMTTFENPNPELIDEFRAATKKVLAIESRRPLEENYGGQVLSLDGGMLFVRDIMIPGNHDLVFSYHFPKFDIKNRDRNYISREELSAEVRLVLASAKNAEVIRSFLFKAKLAAEKGLAPIEFSTPFHPADREQWVNIFHEIFGENATIRDVKDQDFNKIQEGVHIGLDTVTLPSTVFMMIRDAGVKPVEEMRAEMFKNKVDVKEEDMSEEEKEIIGVLKEMDEYLFNNRESEVVLFDPVDPSKPSGAGWSDGKKVFLSRALLRNFEATLDVYYHEKTHHNTGGAADPDPEFRNYLSLTLAKLAVRQLKEHRPDIALKVDAA